MKKNFSQGFVILFTILIASIIMVIGLGMYSVAIRETVISGTSREAQYAFYASDAGVECALYIQRLDNDASTSIFGGSAGSFNCGPLGVRVTGSGTTVDPYAFNVLVDRDRKTCAKVSVYDTTTLLGVRARRIVSQGYNVCNLGDATPIVSNPILVERDLDILYER